jgi:thymidylate synthase (FAD)
MEIIEPKVFVIRPDGAKILRSIERIARLCYKSEDKITEDSAPVLIRKLLYADPPHEAMMDHEFLRARIITDRGVTHELVRHRIGVGYAQESTRYCNYSKGKFGGRIQVIKPPGMTLSQESAWNRAMICAEHIYMEMLEAGSKPQIARAVLPTCVKTEIWVTATLTAWRHFCVMRAANPEAHPQMLQVMVPLCQYYKRWVPVIFDGFDPHLPSGLPPAEVIEEKEDSDAR